MKKILSLIYLGWLLCVCPAVQAQTGIGTNTPSPRSVLDISSSNKGVLIPRIDFANRPIGSVESGMLIYVTANGPAGDNRFYYYNGTQWEGVKNTDDNQTLSLTADTLRISQGNYVLLRNIYSQLGYTPCGTNYVQLASDVQNCGSCGNACNFNNASGFCANNSCYIGYCNTGFGNCDNNGANGCEVNLTNNISNCGACGNVCASGANSSSTCSGGNCGLLCNSGFLNCDGLNGNGCEVNSASNLSNCGSCGNVCPTGANASASCTAGACSLFCNSGFLNCNASNADGCEINSFSDVNNCGTCGHICTVANGTAACTAGACSVGACNSGFANCDNNPANGCEVFIFTNVNNCGGCGNVCSLPNATSVCSAASCQVQSCSTGYGNCDGSPGNGCETFLTNNVANCGACGNNCAIANGTGACTGSTCSIASCSAGFANCNGVRADGCETNISTNTSNCGACGVVCAAGHACVGGVCQ